VPLVNAGCTHDSRPASNESSPSVLAWLERMNFKVVAGCKLQLFSPGLRADMSFHACPLDANKSDHVDHVHTVKINAWLDLHIDCHKRPRRKLHSNLHRMFCNTSRVTPDKHT